MGMRTFLSLDIDEATRGRLSGVAGNIPIGDARIRWVEPDNLHVTLKFLGDVADELVADVCAAASWAAETVEPFDFSVRGVICIPPAGRLRMLWAGVVEPTGRLARLHEQLDAALSEMGFGAEDRPFKPHITLARVKFARNSQDIRAAAESYGDRDFGTNRAGQLVVYSSKLTPEGPVYTPLARAKLGG